MAQDRFVEFLCSIDARHRMGAGLTAAIVTSILLQGHVHAQTQVIATWDAFALTVLILAWVTIVGTDPGQIRERAKRQDVSRKLIFVFVVVAACASLFSVAFLLRTSKAEHASLLTAHLILSLVAVLAAWTLMHTVFGMRYAHTYYGDADDPMDEEHAGGLEFPGEKRPDYLDFAYFSFVLGMTCQVSDVTISSRQLRALALIHGMLSFAFNTVILALTINTATGLL